MNLVEKLEQIAQRDSTAMAALAPYREALTLGRLYACANCRHYAGTVTNIGRCRWFKTETWPLVPFWCSGFEARKIPAAPEFLPDPDGARARAQEYAK